MNQLFFPFPNLSDSPLPSVTQPQSPSVSGHSSSAPALRKYFPDLLEEQRADSQFPSSPPHTDSSFLQSLLSLRASAAPGPQLHSPALSLPNLFGDDQGGIDPSLSHAQRQIPNKAYSEDLALPGPTLPQQPSQHPLPNPNHVSVPTNHALVTGPDESENTGFGSRPQPRVVFQEGRPQPLLQPIQRPGPSHDPLQGLTRVPGERNGLVTGIPSLPLGRIADPVISQAPSTVVTQPSEVPEARLHQEHQSPPSIKSQAHHPQSGIVNRSSESRHSRLQQVQEDIPLLRPSTSPSRVQVTAQPNVAAAQELRSENLKPMVAQSDSLPPPQSFATPLGNTQAARALTGALFAPPVLANGVLSSGAEVGILSTQVNASDMNPSLNSDGFKGHGEQVFRSLGGDVGNGQDLGGGFGHTSQGQGGTQSNSAALGAHQGGIRGLEERPSELFTPTLQRLQMDVQLSEHQRVQVEVGVQQRQVYAGMLVDHTALKNLALHFVPHLDQQLSQVNLELQEFSAEVREQLGSDPGGKPSEHSDLEFQGHSLSSEMNESEESFSSPDGFEKEPGLHLVA